ncbi:MAG: hypothetical protein Q8O38_15185 [Sulfurimicrobium sp.]|nr:hypothetical protein [Sulfurimicrobium sp.]
MGNIGISSTPVGVESASPSCVDALCRKTRFNLIDFKVFIKNQSTQSVLAEREGFSATYFFNLNQLKNKLNNFLFNSKTSLIVPPVGHITRPIKLASAGRKTVCIFGCQPKL